MLELLKDVAALLLVVGLASAMTWLTAAALDNCADLWRNLKCLRDMRK